ncbi:helix-turn-helix domain-containing protein [Confluentibacter flavum]|uniref:DNA-binding protein n=1 Tax=Confluentibacter flavum TaxID=1909700 RepID=A0A2N3HMK8_9FLAO|nr:helix-turn-helix domain-containing protein [Confluentibacter flavum]PKQ46078.1 DNA-binding protein [Confluentibacter flavum]
MKNLKLEDLPKAMEIALEKLSIIEQQLNDLKHNFQPKEPIELITRNEAAEYLKINSTTLWSWTNKGKLKAYGIGARRYYKRSEIEKCMVVLKK